MTTRTATGSPAAWPTSRPRIWSGAARPREPAAGAISAEARLRQPTLGGPAGELVPGGELELAQDGGDVAFDRLDRDVELAGHLLVGVPLGDQPQDLALAGGQLVQFRVERRPDVRRRRGGGERVEHESRQPV